jgi:Lipoprotein LpqB beta-propeller domain/Sporulation and spore germination
MADGRVDRRQVLRALMLAGAGLAAPAACGVPTGGGPIVDGTGPASDRIGGNSIPPPDPAKATSPTDLVEKFLSAVSGPLDTADARRDAAVRARKFLTPPANKRWQPDEQQVTVVRMVGALKEAVAGAGATVVSGSLQRVGVLGPRGDVGPYGGSTAPVPVAFTVVSSTGDTTVPRLIDQLPAELPPGLVLSSGALDNHFFLPQILYFWDVGRRFLVPDLRYVPKTVLPDSAQKAAVVNWLIGGPSDLVSSVAINVLPNGTTLLGPNVVTDPATGALVVNFSGSFQDVDRDRVMAQLRWSLLPFGTAPIQLQIASRPQPVDGSSTRYVSANPADVTYRPADPEGFCVLGGAVAAIDPPYQPPAVLAGSVRNQNVAMAALNRDKSLVALVGQDKRLWVGRLRETDTRAAYTEVGLTGESWSRPAWLPNRTRLLVIVDHTLYAVNTSGGTTVVSSGVDAFAVAPDGYRIALIIDGIVIVAALRDDGDRLSIGTPRPVDPGLTAPSGVAWKSLDRVVVAGRATDGSGWGLAEVSIDGAILVPWTNRFSSAIVSVVGYPQLPSKQSSGQVMVQTADGQSHRAFPTSTSALPTRDPSPSPSGGASTGGLAPTAPFYLD